jgi:hypothetical protein
MNTYTVSYYDNELNEYFDDRIKLSAIDQTELDQELALAAKRIMQAVNDYRQELNEEERIKCGSLFATALDYIWIPEDILESKHFLIEGDYYSKEFIDILKEREADRLEELKDEPLYAAVKKLDELQKPDHKLNVLNILEIANENKFNGGNNEKCN